MTRSARSLLTILGLLVAIVLVAALAAPRGVASPPPQPSSAPATAPAASPAAVVPATLSDTGPHTFTVLLQASGNGLYRPTLAPAEAAMLAARPVSVVWTGDTWWDRLGVVAAGTTLRLVVPDPGATLGSIVLMQDVPAQAGHRYLLTITTTPQSGTAMDLRWTLTDTGDTQGAEPAPAVAVANGAASLLLAPSHLLAQPQYWNEPFDAWQVLLATAH